jgi:hypothetical protein
MKRRLLNHANRNPHLIVGAAPLVVVFGLLAAALPGQCCAAAEPGPAPVGRTRLTFTERHPLSSLDELCRRSGYGPGSFASDEGKKPAYDLADESFEVYVPPGYKPGAPHGLLVWISAGEAAVPPAWFDVLRRHRMIWVCANNAGNRREGAVRSWLALDAVHNITRRYSVDGDRIYIGGFSTGGGLALQDVQWFPDVYRGAYSMMCSNLYENRKNEAGKWERTLRLKQRWAQEVPLERLKKELKIVIMRGALDPQWTPADGRSECEGLQFDGFERVNFVEVPKTGHALPPAAWFERGLVALEAPPKKPPAAGRAALADRIVATALLHLDECKGARRNGIHEAAVQSEASARRYLRLVLDQYPTTPAAARAGKLLEELGSEGVREK